MTLIVLSIIFRHTSTDIVAVNNFMDILVKTQTQHACLTKPRIILMFPTWVIEKNSIRGTKRRLHYTKTKQQLVSFSIVPVISVHRALWWDADIIWMSRRSSLFCFFMMAPTLGGCLDSVTCP